MRVLSVQLAIMRRETLLGTLFIAPPASRGSPAVEVAKSSSRKATHFEMVVLISDWFSSLSSMRFWKMIELSRR